MSTPVQSISIVIPTYLGEETLVPLLAEIDAVRERASQADQPTLSIEDVVLVWDQGPDQSVRVIQELQSIYPYVRAVWLARNFGQHAATVAGIAATSSQWVVTMDEDGQHDPQDIEGLLATAMAERAHLVYGMHATRAPHASWRNATSRAAKATAQIVGGADLTRFSSFRLIDGPRARSVGAYVGNRIFLDAALTWAIDRSATHEVSSRPEYRPASGYRWRSLLSHFWTLVLSSGNRPLRIVSGTGTATALAGACFAAVIVARRLTGGHDVPGWASVVVAVLVTNGVLLFAIGVLAEYVGAILRTSQGRPLYLTVADPRHQADRRSGDT